MDLPTANRRSGWPPLRFTADIFHNLGQQWRRFTCALGQIVYGMTVYDMVRHLDKERANVERLFVAVTFGDLLGIPILPAYHSLRLLPYVLPHLERWRCSMLRERDLTDLCDQEIS